MKDLSDLLLSRLELPWLVLGVALRHQVWHQWRCAAALAMLMLSSFYSGFALHIDNKLRQHIDHLRQLIDHFIVIHSCVPSPLLGLRGVHAAPRSVACRDHYASTALRGRPTAETLGFEGSSCIKDLASGTLHLASRDRRVCTCFGRLISVFARLF